MRRTVLVAALAVTAIIGVASASGSAASDDLTGPTARFARIDPSLLTANGAPLTFTPASASDKQVNVMLELSGAPVTVRDAAAKQNGKGLSKAEKDSIRDQLKAQQDALTGAIANIGGKVVAQLQTAYNGVQVVVPQKAVLQLAQLPGVAAVHAVQTYQRENVNTVPFTGADTAWAATGFTGAGINVAIIDTGIDYTHKDFGGIGTPAAFAYADAHDTIDPASDPQLATEFGPAAPKVKGGFDLVGDAYNPGGGNAVPAPDPNPLDCGINGGGDGHGTHTAGTLGGFGVLSDGSTYSGPYNASTISGHSWNVGPGVAPGVNLYSYRVFGCTGATNVLAAAIDMAAAAPATPAVISMSIGAPLGGTDDPSSVAAQNAVDDGIAVVASAGNNGPNAYVVGSPSTANGVLSVAALDANATFPFANLVVTKGSTVSNISAIDANGAPIPSGTFNVLVLKNADGSIADGCFASQYPTGDLSHTMVVVRRGGPVVNGTPCARVHKAVVGQHAGAAAVAMVNNTRGLPPFEGKITSDPNTHEVITVTIPFLGIAGSASNPPATADTDAAAIYAADGGTVTMTAANKANPGFKTSASFTSGGPRQSDSAPKPDVIAPGVSVASAGVGTGNDAEVLSGTSMSCPATAGVAALVKQAHPTWNGAQLKAAIMNTASSTLNLNYNVRLAGAGAVQAQKAVKSSTLAQTTDGLNALAFAFVAGTGDYTDHKSFTLTNTGVTSVTYNLAVTGIGNQFGSTTTLDQSSVTIPAGQSTTVTTTFSMSAAAFAALPSDDTFAIGPGGVLSIRGVVVATPAGGSAADQQVLSVPYVAVPRGLSNVVAGTPAAFTKQADKTSGKFTSALPLSNTGIHAGTADLYSWGITDPQESGGAWDIRDVGVQVQPGEAFGSTADDRGLVFLVNTWGAASNHSIVEYDVNVDTNGDGTTDYFVVGVDGGAVLAGAFDGRLLSFTINASTGALVDAFIADAPMNGSTVELPALASDLGLSQKPLKGQTGGPRTGFAYGVAAFSELGPQVDTTGFAPFDVFQPSLSSGDSTNVAAGGTASLPLGVDSSQLNRNPALGWLVASVDDASGAAQAGEVPLPSLK